MERFLKALDFSKDDAHNSAPQSIPTSNPSNANDNTDNRRLVQQNQSVHGAQQPGSSPRNQDVKDASTAKAVRLLWCDTAGIRRCRVIPGRRYASAQASGVCITSACMAMPAFADSPAPNAGLSPVGEARMKPVEASRVDLPWCPGHQMAVVEFEAPKTDAPWDYCPRTALKRTLRMLKDNFGLTLKIGFEIEFLLLERVTAPAGAAPTPGSAPGSGGGLMGTAWRPVDQALYCQSSALDRQAEVLDEMVDTLEALGVEVLQWHAESAHGQYEFALSYGDPVEMADKLLLAREALVGVAGRHGLAVSFLPKPYPNAAGSGCHMHLSLWKDGKMWMHVPAAKDLSPAAAGIWSAARQLPHDPSSDSSASSSSSSAADSRTQQSPGQQHPTGAGPAVHEDRPMPIPSPQMQSFLAGLLAYLPVLLPFTAPSPNSYARLRPGAWAGAHAAWGYNNREVPLRVTAPGPSRLDLMHIEFKSIDNTANPYIAVAAITVAGMLGLFANLSLPEPCQVPPADLDAEAATRLGIKMLPAGINEALALLQEGGAGGAGSPFMAAMKEAIGHPLLKAYIAVREAEARQAANDKPADLLLRYS